jgi:GDPmannose 4,6-dehydratase
LTGPREIPTSELKPGDRVQLFTLPRGEEDINITPEEAEFLGLMAGDGHVARDGGSARFTNTDEDLLEKSKRLFEVVTGGNARIDRTKKSGFTGESVPSVEFSGASPWFSLWRTELYAKSGANKVPCRVLNARREIQQLFLQGYNQADGLKSKTCNAEFKCWVTKSMLLGAGLWFLANSLGYRVALNWGADEAYRLNVGDPSPVKGAHLIRPLDEVKSNIKEPEHRGWLFDLATTSGTFSAGIGLTWVHNSPRRGETFVTRKIAKAAARIKLGFQKELVLGNLEAMRDWGHAKDFVKAMWLMLQQSEPDDYVIATGETHSVREFVEHAFAYVGIDNWADFVRTDPKYFRPAEVDALQGDPSKAKRILKWAPTITFEELVHEMVEHELQNASKS